MATIDFDEVPEGDGWLGPREREVQQRYTFAPRRAAWRAGRWAARKALMKLSSADSAAVEIIAAPDGAPEAVFAAGALAASISISHRGRRAAALAAPVGVATGCDVELVEPRTAGFAADWFTAAERAAVSSATPLQRDLMVTLIWSAKETALKVLRQGLRVDPREVAVSVHGDRFEARVGNTLIRGWWIRDGPYVITAAAQEKKQ